MHIIGVVKEHRRKGYGTLMIRDFLQSFPGKVAFEAPNEAVCEILVKLGELEKGESGYRSKGRVCFLQGF